LQGRVSYLAFDRYRKRLLLGNCVRVPVDKEQSRLGFAQVEAEEAVVAIIFGPAFTFRYFPYQPYNVVQQV
jgi:hypothetical protein